MNREGAIASLGITVGATAAWSAFLPPVWTLDRQVLGAADVEALRRSEGAATVLTVGAGAALFAVTGSPAPLIVAVLVAALFVGMYELAGGTASSPCEDCGG